MRLCVKTSENGGRTVQSSNKKIKVVIAVLAILLGLSVLALGGMFVYNYVKESQPATVVVPDNLIDPEPEQGDGTSSAESGTVSDVTDTSSYTSSALTASKPEEHNIAGALTLHKRKPNDNTPFKVNNMFPGDSETKYFCVKVYYKGDIILRYHADVREGYEKLAEVLKVRIRLLDTDETLYDGLMKDMPKSLNHVLKTKKSTQSELYYEITAYLDTSVGNEYMDKSLIADFNWWVEETDNLEAPKTGDNFNIYLWLGLAAGSLLIIILLLVPRRKGKKKDA